MRIWTNEKKNQTKVNLVISKNLDKIAMTSLRIDRHRLHADLSFRPKQQGIKN